MALSGAGRQPNQLDFEIENISGHHLAPEPSVVDSTEEGQLALVAIIGQHGASAELSDRLHLQNPRERRAPREVAREEVLFAGEAPKTARIFPGTKLGDLVHKKERRAVRDEFFWFHA